LFQDVLICLNCILVGVVFLYGLSGEAKPVAKQVSSHDLY
jgi:hypothetical protein